MTPCSRHFYPHELSSTHPFTLGHSSTSSGGPEPAYTGLWDLIVKFSKSLQTSWHHIWVDWNELIWRMLYHGKWQILQSKCCKSAGAPSPASCYYSAYQLSELRGRGHSGFSEPLTQSCMAYFLLDKWLMFLWLSPCYFKNVVGKPAVLASWGSLLKMCNLQLHSGPWIRPLYFYNLSHYALGWPKVHLGFRKMVWEKSKMITTASLIWTCIRVFILGPTPAFSLWVKGSN